MNRNSFEMSLKSRPYRFGLGKRSDDMEYDDAAFLSDQQNWKPWVYERGLFEFIFCIRIRMNF